LVDFAIANPLDSEGAEITEINKRAHGQD
jgi:hypothetical protein